MSQLGQGAGAKFSAKVRGVDAIIHKLFLPIMSIFGIILAVI
jgi:hypothetical protein